MIICISILNKHFNFVIFKLQILQNGYRSSEQAPATKEYAAKKRHVNRTKIIPTHVCVRTIQPLQPKTGNVQPDTQVCTQFFFS